MTQSNPDKTTPPWLEQPGNAQRIIYALYGACAFFILLDLLVSRQSHFFFEAWPGFYAWFGFIACVALVLAAKAMRWLLMRREDYYD